MQSWEEDVRIALEKVSHIASSYEAAKVLGLSDSTVRRFRKLLSEGRPIPEPRQSTRDALRHFMANEFRRRVGMEQSAPSSAGTSRMRLTFGYGLDLDAESKEGVNRAYVLAEPGGTYSLSMNRPRPDSPEALAEEWRGVATWIRHNARDGGEPLSEALEGCANQLEDVLGGATTRSPGEPEAKLTTPLSDDDQRVLDESVDLHGRMVAEEEQDPPETEGGEAG